MTRVTANQHQIILDTVEAAIRGTSKGRQRYVSRYEGQGQQNSNSKSAVDLTTLSRPKSSSNTKALFSWEDVYGDSSLYEHRFGDGTRPEIPQGEDEV